MGFSRQEYWSGLPWPSPGDLPDPGIEPTSPAALMPPASADGFFTTSAPPPGKPSYSPSRNLTQEEQVEDPLEVGLATHFLPGESHGQRSLVGYSPWGCKESDMTEQLLLTQKLVK